ncbi:MAG: hypothetical protein CL677_09675 [Bdellovibrionaceae bacterium]|nr:hypothetical protein [Pseudobdellovibrionaceae bacterium]
MSEITSAEVITPTVASADLFKAEDYRDKSTNSSDDLLAEVNTDDIVSSDDDSETQFVSFDAQEDSMDDDMEDDFEEDDLLDNFDDMNDDGDDEGYF